MVKRHMNYEREGEREREREKERGRGRKRERKLLTTAGTTKPQRAGGEAGGRE